MVKAEIQQVKLRFGIIGNNEALLRGIDVAMQVAPTDLSVLITGMLGRKGAFDDVCGTVGYKLFDLRIRFDADDYAACDIVCHCI